MEIRPMQPDDVPLAEELSGEAFHQVDMARRRPGDPEPARRSAHRAASWVERTNRFLLTDAGGCLVAYDDEGLAGFATSVRREGLWVLATFAVRPTLQGRGVGARLLDGACAYGADCPRWMLAASDDPKALRRYRLAGFDLHPQMTLRGPLDRALLPAAVDVREGKDDDVELLDHIDRQVRGAAHGPDHESLAAADTLVVDRNERGYAYAAPGGPMLLAALDEPTAARLLWECLARTEGEVDVQHVTGANQWALAVGTAARLAIGTRGYLGVRGMAPPAAYIHHGAVL